ncbi:MAG: hypothetical protein IPL27_02940 [Lewinellaceae bacterium]|nr:hypothetical protein [Lewinellaceae bacterium]
MIHRLLHFESKHEQLLPKNLFYNRLFKSMLAGILIIVFFWCRSGGLSFHLQDSWLIAAQCPDFSGMGRSQNKRVAALVSGVVFITAIGIIVAPVTHRIFHRFHIEDEVEQS